MIQLGQFELEALAGLVELESETTSGVKATGHGVTYLTRGPLGTLLTVGDVYWSNGERDVRVLDRHVSPQRLDRLRQGLRLGVHQYGSHRVVDLGQARLKEGDWSNLFQASFADLDNGAGVDVRRCLLGLGAQSVDTRARALGDVSRRRNYLCASFDDEHGVVAVGAYVLTRIAPLVHEVRA